MKKLIILILIVLGCGYVFLHGFPDFIVNLVNDHQDGVYEEEADDGKSVLTSTSDINLRDEDGGGENYAFTYKGQEFKAHYMYDYWTVYDSYKITNEDDQTIICQALIDTHTVHGRDMESFRTAEDMAYEWQQHNLACKYLPDDSDWRDSAENVDFDPYDQGRSFEEIYEDRTGEEFSIKKEIKESLEDGTFFDKVKKVVFH